MRGIRARVRADGSTYYTVPFRHQGRQTSRSFDDPARAARWKRLLDQLGPAGALDILDSGRTDADTPTLTEWLEHYLAHATGATAGTRAEYRRLAQRTWLPVLGHLPVDVPTRDTIRRWVGQQSKTVTRRGTPTSAKTIANAHGLLSAVMAEAVDAGHRGDNPCRGVKLPSGERDEMVVLTDSELAVLVHHVPGHWRPLVAFLAGTGLRWGEATALRWRDLDLDARPATARVARAWKRGETTREIGAPKTKRSRRTVHVPERVAALLRPLRGRPDDLVFIGPQGGGVHHQAFHPRVWRPAVEASGLGKHPRIHDLRHTAASQMLARGVPITVVQRQLGHESITTTVDTYGHMMPGGLEVAAAALDDSLALALPDVEGTSPALGP